MRLWWADGCDVPGRLMIDEPSAAHRVAPRQWLRILALALVTLGVVMIASASRWGPGAVALFDGTGILPQFATSVPFWPLVPIAFGAWLWMRSAKRYTQR